VSGLLALWIADESNVPMTTIGSDTVIDVAEIRERLYGANLVYGDTATVNEHDSDGNPIPYDYHFLKRP
jgi:hypothetical protein